ncbi:hypothetical protein BH18ACT6_BH18ACT6_19210 [soil metagenome]
MLAEPVCSRFVGTLVKVPVDAQHRPNRAVSKAVCYDLWVLALSDQKRDLGVPQRVCAEVHF